MNNNYETIKLEKGLYNMTGKSFTQALENLDPSENYVGTKFEKLDSFERQLKRFDIKISGRNCDRVEKFFMSTDSAVLFPEYVRRTIKQGMDDASILGDICSAVSYTDSIDFRGLSVTNSGTDSGVEQGASLPTTTLKLASEPTEVTKYARVLSCSYESVRKQRIEAFSVVLRNLGARIARSINADAVTVAKDTTLKQEVAAKGVITYSDLTAFWAKMNDFDMTTMICTPQTMGTILAFDQMKYCVSDYMANGRVVTPYGVTIVKSSSLTGALAVGIDKENAIEAVFATDVCVDIDKLISTQCDEISCSVMVGFSKINAGATAILADKA